MGLSAGPLGAELKGSIRQIRRGTVERLNGQNWQNLRVGSPVDYGDRIRTGPDAVVYLSMPGQGEFVIGPNTDMTLARNETRGEMKVERGAMWLRAKLQSPRTIQAVTPHMVAGVRGTSFSVLTDTDGSALCTCRGLVDVTLPDSRVLQSATGQFVPVDIGAPSPKGPMSDRRLLRRVTGGRYDWCFTCHEVGGRGRLRRDWVAQ